MLTADQIREARSQTYYTVPDGKPTKCDDCVRLAFEWLDAQARTKSPNTRYWSLKHLVEDWSGMHISRTDVEVAAHLHGLIGLYPNYNIHTKWVEPSLKRLEGIARANSVPSYREHHKTTDYHFKEE